MQKTLASIVKNLPDDIVEIAVDDKLLASISCGSYQSALSAFDAAEFPELPQVEKSQAIAISNSTLKSMISDTIHAISDNENKPIHTGSLFDLKDTTLSVVSVDGYRLAIRREIIENPKNNAFHFVIPGDTLKEVIRILPDDEEITYLYPERKYALFEIGGTVVTTRLLEGEFLNYQAAIPQDFPIQLKVERDEITRAVERASLMIVSDRLKNPIRCVFEDTTLKLSCVTTRGSSYEEIRIPECPEMVEIGFNNRYLLDALKACEDEECVIQLKSGLSPCLITPVEGDKYLYLVLPVRLKAGD